MFDRCRTINKFEALTEVLWSSCQWILTEELHMKWVAAKFVPRLLSEDHRANRLDVCRETKDQLKTDPDFLSKIITGDESWYGYDPETKQQSSQRKSASSLRPKRRGKSNQMWKPCWSASWTSKGSSTLNSYHKVRLLTSSFTLKCSSDCVVLCEENAPNCGGQVSGFCITTMLPPTKHWVCGSFSQNTEWQRLRNPPTPQTWHPAVFFPVSKKEEGP